jgi:predicted glycosyltransferase involved in capsule biosynthesis
MQMKNSKISVGVVIPWRETEDRLLAFNKLVNWYKNNLPDYKLFFSDRTGPTWSMTGSRNDGVFDAKQAGCDVIVLNDADTFPQLEVLKETVQLAFLDNKIHVPYKEVRVLNEKESQRFLNDSLLYSYIAEISLTDCSGINVFTPEAWESVGGADEKFIGWGYEDDAMQHAHKVVHKTSYVSHAGHIFRLSHDRQPANDVNSNNNKKLYDLYQSKNTPNEILNLVKTKTIYELGDQFI